MANRLRAGQRAGGFTVLYLAENGGSTRLPTAASDESVSFTVTHFSHYALVYDETLPGACRKDDECPMTDFTDLDKSLWYHDGVHWALEQVVMNGVGGGRFEPDTPWRASPR